MSMTWESSEVSALSDRLNAARGDRSVRSVGRAAQKVNGTGESTVIPYFNGKHGVPSLPVLEALAHVLDVPLSELRTAAGLPAGERLPYKPPAEADLLSRSQRAALDALIKSIVEPQGATHDQDTFSSDSHPTPAARAQGTEDQKTLVHATDVDTGTDPEGQAADDARPNVWRDNPTDLSERRSRREAGSAPSYAEQLGLTDILSEYGIGQSEKQDRPFKALWNAGYRYEHRDLLRAAFNAASNISGTKSGSLRPGKSGTKFWEAFAEQLGGTYTYKGFDLPEAEPIASAARHLDPRFAPDDPAGFYGTNDIGEENQDTDYDE